MTRANTVRWMPGAEAKQRCAACIAWPEEASARLLAALQNGFLAARGDVSISWFFAEDRYVLDQENSERPIGVRTIVDANVPEAIWNYGNTKNWIILSDRAFLGVLRSRGLIGRTRVDIKIEKLFYRRDQVEALWPSPSTGRAKFGEPGRPSTKRWCEVKSKEWLNKNPGIISGSELARVLLRDFGREFPGEEAPALNTIRNIIAPIVREFKAKQR